MKMNDDCKACLLGKYLNKHPSDAGKDDIKAYRLALEEIVQNKDGVSAPEIVERFEEKYRELFGNLSEFERVKPYFNELMMSYEEYMKNSIDSSADPVKTAVQYAMAGNFIDFGALKSVEEEKLRELLSAFDRARLDDKAVESLKRDIKNAKTLVYFADNCGEIVADKLLISTLRKINPDLDVSVIVRGKPVLNDVTAYDARQVGLYDVARVISNGSGIAGNVLSKISEEAQRAVYNADVLISKGQGNFESLSTCGLNVYYIFMCKCELFVRRFGVRMLDGILVRESDIPQF